MKKHKKIFMETTKIGVGKTVAEIQRVLGEYGARSILVEYDNSEVSAVMFELAVHGQVLGYKLPCRWEKLVPKFIDGRTRASTPSDMDKEKAKRVAWRQTFRWVQAQLAYTDTDMVKPEEVFGSYLIVSDGKTLYELLEERHFKLLDHKGKGGKDG